VARGRVWQADYMISGIRDQVLALICLRHGVPAVQARGVDDLAAGVTDALVPTLVRSLDPAELARAFAATTEALLTESATVAAALSARLARLAGPLRALAGRP
jgi:hypothetical protein